MEEPGPVAADPVPTVKEVFLGWLTAWVIWLLAKTWRLRVEDPARLHAWMHGEPLLVAFWHNRLLPMPIVWSRFIPPGRPHAVALSSASGDGEMIAQVINRFGVHPIRGSATRRGSRALREMKRFLDKGHDVGVTPDGSRGPRYEIKPGLVLAAQLTGRAILPLSCEFSSAWRLKSWDRFFIPKPFSIVTIVLGDPHRVPRTSTPEEFEAARQACQAALLAPIREW